jgi:hypothetical protein
MAFINSTSFDPTQPGILPNGAVLIGQQTVLFDGKTLNTDDTDFWQTVGTGTQTFTSPGMKMDVTSGQYVVRQSRRFIPYFSGMPQVPELTYLDFTTQANVVKRIGYFSSIATAPYDTVLDGWWLEDDGTTKRLRAARAGTDTVNVPAASWTNFAKVASYDYSKFTAQQFYILWLGGAAYQFYLCLPGEGFALIHSGAHVGVNTGTVTKTPNQPLRYEIRSSTGTGTLTAICSQVFCAGPIAQSGKAQSIFNSPSVTCNTVDTIYALLGIKKLAARRDISIKLTNMGVVNTASTDCGMLILYRTPTISAPLTYTTVGNIQRGAPGSVITVTAGTGRILYATAVSSAGASLEFDTEFLTWLTHGIDDTMDEYIVAYMPTTSNQSINAVLNFEEYV